MNCFAIVFTNQRKANMKSYYSFDFNRNGFVLGDTFDIVQKEIKLKKEMAGSKSSFEILDVTYKCTWKEKKFDNKKPTIIIPTKKLTLN